MTERAKRSESDSNSLFQRPFLREQNSGQHSLLINLPYFNNSWKRKKDRKRNKKRHRTKRELSKKKLIIHKRIKITIIFHRTDI